MSQPQLRAALRTSYALTFAIAIASIATACIGRGLPGIPGSGAGTASRTGVGIAAPGDAAIPANETIVAINTPTRTPTRTATPTRTPTATVTPSGIPAIALTQVATGLSSAIAITNAGDGSGRLFVTEQSGRIRIVEGGLVLPTPFLDVSSLVSCCGEQGLLSVTFHPSYATNGFLYVNYTNTAGDTIVARYTRSAANVRLANPASAQILLTIDQPFANHNGGQLQFGPDGYLYIGMGDGGSGGDPNNYAQNIDSLLGKMLRIDVNGALPYAIPAGNPYAGVAGADEIWAIGLRNPWRFSFDRLTGDLWIGDVGQGAREEIDFTATGTAAPVNYGWRLMEGIACYNPSTGCNPGGLTLPVLDYDHSAGDCAVTGGYRYRGGIASLRGVYFYSDYCSGRVWGATKNGAAPWASTMLLDSPYNVPAFGEDESGEVYVSGGSAIYRIILAP